MQYKGRPPETNLGAAPATVSEPRYILNSKIVPLLETNFKRFVDGMLPCCSGRHAEFLEQPPHVVLQRVVIQIEGSVVGLITAAFSVRSEMTWTMAMTSYRYQRPIERLSWPCCRASTISFTSPAAVANGTRRRCWHAATHSAVAKCPLAALGFTDQVVQSCQIEEADQTAFVFGDGGGQIVVGDFSGDPAQHRKGMHVTTGEGIPPSTAVRSAST